MNNREIADYRTLALLTREKEANKIFTRNEAESYQKNRGIVSKLFDSYAAADGKIYKADLSKYGRLKSFEKEVSSVLQETATKNHKTTKAELERILADEYAYALYSFERKGQKPSILKMTDKEKLAILNEDWSGKNYHQIEKQNTIKMQNRITDQLSVKTLAGATRKDVEGTFYKEHQKNIKDNQRLIQTEITRKKNQARLLAAQKAGLNPSGYEWIAVIGDRTCQTCRALDGKIFKAENIPIYPVHPHCRCVLEMVFDEDSFMADRRIGENSDYQMLSDDSYKDWLIKKDFRHEPITPDKSTLANLGKIESAHATLQKLGISNVDLSDLDEEHALEITKSLEILSKKYPQVTSDQLKNLHSLDYFKKTFLDLGGEMGDISAWHALAYAYDPDFPELSGIMLNTKKYGKDSIKGTLNQLKEYERDGYIPKGTYRADTTLVHEYGHLVDFYLQDPRNHTAKKREEIKNLYAWIDAEKKKINSFDEAKNTLSIRAMEDREEFVAELFREYHISKNPRPLAKEYGARLEKILKGEE